MRQREFDRFAQSLPERVARPLEKGRNKVAFDLLRLLADGPRRPAELQPDRLDARHRPHAREVARRSSESVLPVRRRT